MIWLPYLGFRQICTIVITPFAGKVWILCPDVLKLVAVDEIDQLDPIVDADFVEDVVDMFFDCVGRYS